jgi:hypothetical protein
MEEGGPGLLSGSSNRFPSNPNLAPFPRQHNSVGFHKGTSKTNFKKITHRRKYNSDVSFSNPHSLYANPHKGFSVLKRK